MSETTIDTMYLIYTKPALKSNWLYYSLEKPNHNRASSKLTKFTTEARLEIPDRPSNLAIYLRKYESYEYMLIGYETGRGEAAMTSELAVWEARWEALSKKWG